MAQLSIFRGGRLEGVFYLPEKPVLIGRADGVDIQLLDSKVSRRHAVIRESVAGYIIQDLDTKNGTFVNSEAIERSLLFHADTVAIGGYTLKFTEEEDGDAQALDAGFVSPLKEENAPSLQVPESLSGDRGPNPRARTARGPEGTPKRVSRLDRDRPPAPRGRARAAQAAVGGRGDVDPDDTGGDGTPGPRFAPPDSARQPDRGAPTRQFKAPDHTLDGVPEIREVGGEGVGFVPDAGNTTVGFGIGDAIQLHGDETQQGSLFTVRRSGPITEIRAASSLRPILLNGAPVIAAEAFPGDVFEVGGRRFAIHLRLGELDDIAVSDETVLGVPTRRIEEALQRRKAEADAALAAALALQVHIDETGEHPPDGFVPVEEMSLSLDPEQSLSLDPEQSLSLDAEQSLSLDPEQSRSVDPEQSLSYGGEIRFARAPAPAPVPRADRSGGLSDVDSLPRELVEEANEWVADSLRTAEQVDDPYGLHGPSSVDEIGADDHAEQETDANTLAEVDDPIDEDSQGEVVEVGPISDSAPPGDTSWADAWLATPGVSMDEQNTNRTPALEGGVPPVVSEAEFAETLVSGAAAAATLDEGEAPPVQDLLGHDRPRLGRSPSPEESLSGTLVSAESVRTKRRSTGTVESPEPTPPGNPRASGFSPDDPLADDFARWVDSTSPLGTHLGPRNTGPFRAVPPDESSAPEE